MPRQARHKSESGYLHLIVRGIGQQTLFEEREDYQYFLSALMRFSRETEVVICAYCLMQNHVHILARDDGGQTALLMKKLGVSYSQYFNKKYERQGHLFQDRYLSEPVEDERYLLTVFRYILNNPTKAGICPAADYEWSSYRLYGQKDGPVNTTLLCALIGEDDRYAEFIASPNEDQCLEYEAVQRDDVWAREIIQARLGVQSGTALQSLDRAKRNEALRQLLNEGLSIRQIERMTGISKGIIQKVKR